MSIYYRDCSSYQYPSAILSVTTAFYKAGRMYTYVVMRPMHSIDSSVMYMKLVRSTDRRDMPTTYV